MSLRSALPSAKTQNRVSQVLQVQVPLNHLRKKSTAKDTGTPSVYSCIMIFISVILISCFKSLVFPSDSNSPQVVKKPPVSSSEEWSSKRPSDDAVSLISSLHSSPTVSPHGSPRKGAFKSSQTTSELFLMYYLNNRLLSSFQSEELQSPTTLAR